MFSVFCVTCRGGGMEVYSPSFSCSFLFTFTIVAAVVLLRFFVSRDGFEGGGEGDGEEEGEVFLSWRMCE